MCVCLQLNPVVQNALSHDQSSSAPEPVLHKDELDSILGDVSGAHVTCRYHRCRRDVNAVMRVRHKMAALLIIQTGNVLSGYDTSWRTKQEAMCHGAVLGSFLFLFFPLV